MLVQFVFIFVSIQVVYGGQSEQPVTEGINISHLFATSRNICKITYVICLKSKVSNSIQITVYSKSVVTVTNTNSKEVRRTQMFASCWTRGCIITGDVKMTILSCILVAKGADNGTDHPKGDFILEKCQ